MAVKTTDEFVIPLSVKDEVTSKLKEIEKAVKSFMTALDQGAVSKMGSSLAQAGSTAAKVSKGMKDSGNAAKEANSSISIYGLTLGKVSAVIFTANAYLDFFNRTLRTFTSTIGAALAPSIALEAGLAKISTVLPEGTKSLESFKKEILDFQSNFGAKQEDVIRGYYDMLQSGAVDAADATQLMTVAQKMAVAGFSTSDKMIQGLISVLANYNMEARDAARIADLMAIANMNGRVSIEGLADNIGQVAGLANMMNISLEETLSAMSTISMATSNSAEAMTSFRAIITGMSTQTGQFSEIMQKLGYNSIQAMVAQKGFIGTIQALIQESGNSAEALSAIFGRVEAKVGLAALTAEKTSKVYGKNMEDMKASVNDAGSVIEKQFGKVMDTTQKKLEVLSGSLTTLLANLTFGSIDGMKGALDSLISSIQNVNNNFKSLIDTYALLTNGSNILTDAFKSLGEAILIVAASIATIKIGAFIAAAGGIGAAAIAMAPLLATVIAVTAAVEAAIFVFRNWDVISYEFGMRIKQIQSYFLEWKIEAEKAFYVILDGFSKVGLVSEKFAHDFRLGVLKDVDAQKELNNEIENSNAKYNEMIKDIKGSYLYEFFTKGSQAVDIFSNSINEAENGAQRLARTYDKVATTKKPFIPETRTKSLNAKVPFEDYSKYFVFGDETNTKLLKQYEKMKVSHAEYLRAIEKANAEFNTVDGANNRKQLEKNIINAEESFRKERQTYQQMMYEAYSKSGEARKEILKKSMQDQGLNEAVKNMEIVDKIKEAKDQTIELTKAAEQYGLVIEGLADDFRSAQWAESKEADAIGRNYDRAVEFRKNLVKELDARKASLALLEKERDLSERRVKWESKIAPKVQAGGMAAFDINQIETAGKNFGMPLANGMASFTGFMAGPLGMVSAASMILDGLTSIVNMIAELPGKFVGLIKAVNDMPTTMLKSLKELPRQIEKSITELPLNLQRVVMKFLDMGQILGDALSTGIEKALSNPEMFNSMGQGLGKMIVNGFRAAISYMNIWATLVISIAKNAKMIVKEFVKGFVLEFKRLANDIAKLFRMKKFFDIDEATKKLDKFSEKLRTSAQQMFSVLDLDQAKKGADISRKIGAALSDAKDFLSSIIKWLIDHWKEIIDPLGIGRAIWNTLWSYFKDKNIWDIIPFGGFAKKVWDQLKEHFKDKAIWDIILFAGFGEKIWGEIKEFFKDKAIWDIVLFGGFGEKIWSEIKQFFKDKAIWDIVLFGGFGEKIWSEIKLFFKDKAIWDILLFGGFGKMLWDEIYGFFKGKAIWDLLLFGGFGQLVWNELWGFFKDKKLVDILIFGGIGEMVWNGISTALSGVKISDVLGIGDIGGAVWESIKGTLTGKDITSLFMSGGGSVVGGPGFWESIFGIGGVGVIAQATGGPIYAAGGFEPRGTDIVPAMLTPGEFVVNRQSTAANFDLLKTINSSRGPIVAAGGSTSVFNITINASTLLSADSIKRDIVPAVERELKRKSLDGSFVIAASGIRK